MSKAWGKRGSGKRTQRLHSQKAQQAPADADEEACRAKQLQQSLQMPHDPRFKEIEYFNGAESSRLERITGKGSPQRLEPGRKLAPLDAQRVHPSEEILDDETLRLAERACDESERSRRFGGRIGWEDSFRSTAKKLMVDFNLSSDPTCRLNHLDRVHHWFTSEGKKQTRKEKPSPNFLTFESHQQSMPGSARNIASPVGRTTIALAASMDMLRYPKLEKHIGVAPPPPPPPGYK